MSFYFCPMTDSCLYHCLVNTINGYMLHIPEHTITCVK